jgi:hypothetical protein
MDGNGLRVFVRAILLISLEFIFGKIIVSLLISSVLIIICFFNFNLPSVSSGRREGNARGSIKLVDEESNISCKEQTGNIVQIDPKTVEIKHKQIGSSSWCDGGLSTVEGINGQVP